MTTSALEQLHHADATLTRAFVANIACGAALFVLAYVVAATGARDSLAASASQTLILLAQVGCYVWYAIAAGTAAHLVGGTRWHYVAWVLAAPLVAMIPIPVVASLVRISPLAIKFLLGGQLQSAIRAETFRIFHEAPTPPATTTT